MTTVELQKGYYCGIDLHARSMFVCVMDAEGHVLFHRNMPNNFQLLVRAISSWRSSIAIGVESTYNWYWLADACATAGIEFYLGHALYMKAILGGKNKNDRIDSKKLADLLRCNLFPLAYPYPKKMRATRDLLRRRHRYVALRAEAYTHIQNTFTQQGILTDFSAEVKNKQTRRQLPLLLKDRDVVMAVEADLDMIEALDQIIHTIEKEVYAQAKHHDRKALAILMTVPGIGEMLALTILYEICTISRFPSAQEFSSYCRLVKCEQISNGKAVGEGNNKIGNPHLKWAFSEIIIHAQRHSAPIKKYYEKLKAKHGPGKAKSIIAHKFDGAAYYMLKNGEAFDEKRFVS